MPAAAKMLKMTFSSNQFPFLRLLAPRYVALFEK